MEFDTVEFEIVQEPGLYGKTYRYRNGEKRAVRWFDRYTKLWVVYETDQHWNQTFAAAEYTASKFEADAIARSLVTN